MHCWNFCLHVLMHSGECCIYALNEIFTVFTGSLILLIEQLREEVSRLTIPDKYESIAGHAERASLDAPRTVRALGLRALPRFAVVVSLGARTWERKPRYLDCPTQIQ